MIIPPIHFLCSYVMLTAQIWPDNDHTILAAAADKIKLFATGRNQNKTTLNLRIIVHHILLIIAHRWPILVIIAHHCHHCPPLPILASIALQCLSSPIIAHHCHNCPQLAHRSSSLPTIVHRCPSLPSLSIIAIIAHNCLSLPIITHRCPSLPIIAHHCPSLLAP